MTEQTSGYGRKVAFGSAEKRMRQWAIGLEVQERVECQPYVEQLPEQVHPYIAISRDTGAGATEIAKRVSEVLEWDLLNREVLNVLATEFNLEKQMVDAADETTRSWLVELFGKWISQRVVTQTEYSKRLGQSLLMAARHRSTVFVGRGAQYFLPRRRGLAVRIIAPLEQRLERMMQKRNLTEEAARKHIKKTDRERSDFIREHFDRDTSDPHLYDLIVNRERLDEDFAVDLIVHACKRRFDLA